MAFRSLYKARRLLSWHKYIYVYTDKANNPAKIFSKIFIVKNLHSYIPVYTFDSSNTKKRVMKTFIEISKWVKSEMRAEGYTMTGSYSKMVIRREIKSLI